MIKTLNKKSSGKAKGCLLTVLAVLFIGVSGFYFLTEGVRDAKHLEQTVIDRFGWAKNYTPAIDGSIPPLRIEKFIRVRQAVQTQCTDYQAVLVSINKLEEMENNPEISAGEAVSTSMESVKSMFSAGPRMVNFSGARNQALLDEEMGIGEYMYIYLTTYGEQLAGESTSAYSNMNEAFVSPRAREEFTQILTNQLLALEASGQQSSYADLVNQLQQEIDALKDGARSSPWPDGPIGMARESLAPYQQQLENLYCPGIVKIELLQKNRGFQLEG